MSSFPIVFFSQTPWGRPIRTAPGGAEIKFRQSTEDAWRGSMKGVASAARKTSAARGSFLEGMMVDDG